MDINVVDVSHAVEDEDASLCPLCDQPVWRSDSVAIGAAGETLALIHAACGEELEDGNP